MKRFFASVLFVLFVSLFATGIWFTTRAADTAFITSRQLGTVRNDYTGWFGMNITVGSQPITVRSIGRIFLAGNNGSHTVKIVRASDNVDIASVSVSMPGGTNGVFKYANLTTPVTLQANTAYYVASQELQGGDMWCDDETTTVTSTSVGTVNGRVYNIDGTTWGTVGSVPGKVFVPVDFLYDTTPTPTPIFSDDFNDNVRDPAKWIISTFRSSEGVQNPGVTVLEQNQRLEISPLANTPNYNYNGYVSFVNTYDLTGKSAQVEVVQATSANQTAQMFLTVGSNSDNLAEILKSGSQLYFREVFNGSVTSTSVDYSSIQHRFWRVRHNPATDTILFETSADGNLWTTQRTIARLLAITSLRVELSAGTYGAAASPGTAIFDNFKLETTTPTPTPTWQDEYLFPGVSGFNGITGEDNVVHVVTSRDDGGGIGPITYFRSTNQGANGSWSSGTVIANGVPFLEDPLVSQGDNVALFYFKDLRPIDDFVDTGRLVGNLFAIVSNNGGLSWGNEKQVGTQQGGLRMSAVWNGTSLHVVWMDFRSYNPNTDPETHHWDLYYNRLLNANLPSSSWGIEQVLVTGMNKVGANRPGIDAIDNSIHITWFEGVNGKPGCTIDGGRLIPICTEVFYKRLTENGDNWGQNVRLTNSTAYSGRPDIATVAPSTVLIGLDRGSSNYGTGGTDTYMLRSTNNFSNLTETALNTGVGDATHTSIVGVGNKAQMVWLDSRTGTFEVYYRLSNIGGFTWGEEEKVFTGLSTPHSAPLTAITDNYAHVISTIGGIATYRRRFVP